MDLKEKIREIIRILKTGGRQQIKIAKKDLNKILDREEYDEEIIYQMFIHEIKNFDEITNPVNQESFVLSLRIFFCDIENYFEPVLDFLFKIIRHENGKLRYAAIRAFDRLQPALAEATVPPRLPMFRTVSEKRRKDIKSAYFNLIDKTCELSEKHCKPEYRKYKFVSDLPVSVYKSLQSFLSILFRCGMEEEYEKYSKNKETEEILKAYDFKNKGKWDLYYDAMEMLYEKLPDPAIHLLNRSLEIDNDFVATYEGLVQAYWQKKDKGKINRNVELGWEKTLKKFPEWPEELHWGVIENRQYLRAVCNKATQFHKKGMKEEAEEIYRLLLKLNPGDNQGIRYLLAALFRGLMPENVDKMTDEGNKKQDWRKLENLLYEENKKHRFFEYAEDKSEEINDDNFDDDFPKKGPCGTA